MDSVFPYSSNRNTLKLIMNWSWSQTKLTRNTLLVMEVTLEVRDFPCTEKEEIWEHIYTLYIFCFLCMIDGNVSKFGIVWIFGMISYLQINDLHMNEDFRFNLHIECME